LHRNGNRVIFSELSAALRGIPGTRQYQVIQNEIRMTTVKTVADRPVDAEVASAFRQWFGYVPESLAVEPIVSIPRGANGKTYWCCSHV